MLSSELCWSDWQSRLKWSEILLKRIYFKWPLLLLALIFCSIFFPGLMSGDSKTIYQQAVQHSYTDHHPPLMALMWHYLNYIHDGSALMFLFNMLLLWSSIYILFSHIFKETKYLKYLCLFIPFLPQVAVYAGWIWKDVIFTFGYGLLSMILANKMQNDQKFSWPGVVAFFAALLYFTSVKFQAQFVSPIMVCWFFYVQTGCKFNLKVILKGLGIGLCLIFAINQINHLLVTKQGSGSTHSWQFVKIFDLAGISVNVDQVLMPKELFVKPDITIEDVKRKYGFAWDHLVMEEGSPFRKADNEHERQILLAAWKQAVQQHPIAYLQHRISRWYYGMIAVSPGKAIVTQKLTAYPKLAKLQPLTSLNAFVFLVPLIIFSLYVARRALKVNDLHRQAVTILFLLSMGLWLVSVLMFKSLTVDPRYIYFAVYLFMLSLPFTARCCMSILRRDVCAGSKTPQVVMQSMQQVP